MVKTVKCPKFPRLLRFALFAPDFTALSMTSFGDLTSIGFDNLLRN